MSTWYYIASPEAVKGTKVAILEVPNDNEIDRVILIEDAETANYPKAVVGLVGVRARSLANPTKEYRFFANGGQWFEFRPDPMTEELCAVTQGPFRRFGFVGQI